MGVNSPDDLIKHLTIIKELFLLLSISYYIISKFIKIRSKISSIYFYYYFAPGKNQGINYLKS